MKERRSNSPSYGQDDNSPHFSGRHSENGNGCAPHRARVNGDVRPMLLDTWALTETVLKRWYWILLGGLNINAPFSGLLRLYVDRPNTNLVSGFVWAEFEPKILEAESNALAEARSKIDERERLLLQLELPKQKIELSRKIDELEKNVKLMRLFVTNPAVAGKAIPLTGVKEKSFHNEAIARAEEELRIAQENYSLLARTNLQVLGHDFQSQRSDLERRQLEFDRQAAQARLKMPFDGQLNPSLPLAEGVNEYPVNSGQELAVVRDLSTILLRIPLVDASWSTLPTDQLTAVVGLPDGTRLEAPFAFKKLERVQLREDVIYYFQFPTNCAASAARLVGTEVSCELWLGLMQPAHVVPKLTLVLHQPAAFASRKWNEGLARLSPGASLLVEGQTDIAVVLPDHDQRLKRHAFLRRR
ncbi:MAG: hypothetical protein L0Y58_12100 [Verrucomicrobia subdivision 3 bacterium]|nr:hypothetical protein [Limisphaerales bacterium]